MSKAKKVTPRTKGGIVFNDKHLTKQDHGRTADINFIAQQYMSGRLPYPDNPPAFYGDISAVDVQESRNILKSVESAFEELPSDVRDHFEYDSANYVSFLAEQSDAIASRGLRDVLYDIVNPEPELVQTGQNLDSFAQSAEKNEATDAEGGENQHS